MYSKQTYSIGCDLRSAPLLRPELLVFSYEALQQNMKAFLPTDYTNTLKIRRVIPLIPIFVIFTSEMERRARCRNKLGGQKGERRRREATHPDAAAAGLVFNHRKATADRFDPARLPSKETHNDASETPTRCDSLVLWHRFQFISQF